MREPFTQLYLHCVWATWDRLPLITPDIEKRVYGEIIHQCRQLKCIPICVGGIQDHVHLLVRLHTTVSVATLVKQVKGSPSHLTSHAIRPGEFFKWQGAYGAFTVRCDDVPILKQYIWNQKQHHSENNLRPEWEKTEIARTEELDWQEFSDEQIIAGG